LQQQQISAKKMSLAKRIRNEIKARDIRVMFIVCDFKSLYPSIVRTFNIDPYSYVAVAGQGLNIYPKEKYVTVANGAVFKNQKEFW